MTAIITVISLPILNKKFFQFQIFAGAFIFFSAFDLSLGLLSFSSILIFHFDFDLLIRFSFFNQVLIIYSDFKLIILMHT